MRPKKKLVVAERTKFMSMKQKIDEPVIKYLNRLRVKKKKLGKKNRRLKRT